MRLREQSYVVFAIWLLLLGAAVFAAFQGRWSSAFVSLATLALTTLPLVLQRVFPIRIPVIFTAAIIVFTYLTLFLGEVGDFYGRYWWWDIALHGGSAIGFGLIGFVFIFLLFGGNRFAAPPLAIAWFSFAFAVCIGALWEIFEFTMDQSFALNMQKSGLYDTMGDLIVDAVGACFAAATGYFYLRGRRFAFFADLIDEFVDKNQHLFKRRR